MEKQIKTGEKSKLIKRLVLPLILTFGISTGAKGIDLENNKLENLTMLIQNSCIVTLIGLN